MAIQTMTSKITDRTGNPNKVRTIYVKELFLDSSEEWNELKRKHRVVMEEETILF